MGSSFEIHKSMFSNKKSPSYFLVVDHGRAVNQQTREVLEYNKELANDLNKLWTAK